MRASEALKIFIKRNDSTAWKNWRDEKVDKNLDTKSCHLSGANLSGFDLHNLDFSFADLSGANLRNANLSNALFHHTRLEGCDFTGANLNDAQFHHGKLSHALFDRATLNRTSFHYADLSLCDLSESKHLSESALAGAALGGATLPSNFTFIGLQHVEKMIERKHTLFVSLIVGSMVLASASFLDYFDMVTNTRAIALPFLRTEVSIQGFFTFVPLGIFFFWLYFYNRLYRLWLEIAALPVIFPNGSPIEKHIVPWMLAAIVGTHRGHKTGPAMNLYGAWLLGWLLPSLSLILFWVNYLIRHHWHLTFYHILLIAVHLWVGNYFYRKGTAILHGPYKPLSEASRLSRTFATIATVLFILMIAFISHKLIFGKQRLVSQGHLLEPFLYLQLDGKDFSQKPAYWDDCQVPDLIFGQKEKKCHPIQHWPREQEAFVTYANSLKRNEFPELDWMLHYQNQYDLPLSLRKSELKLKLLSLLVPPKSYQELNLNHGNLKHTFFVNTQLRNLSFIKAEMEAAQFQYSQFTNINAFAIQGKAIQFRHTQMKETSFENATIPEADYSFAHLEKTNFHNANISKGKFYYSVFDRVQLKETGLNQGQFYGAIFHNTSFDNTNLERADLRGTHFSKCEFHTPNFENALMYSLHFDGFQMNRANFKGSCLAKSSFAGAQLVRANFFNANLEGVFFNDADLTLANLKATTLNHAQFPQATLTHANFLGAVMENCNFMWADLSGARFTNANLKNAYFNGANLKDVILDGADLRGADLSEALNLRREQLKTSLLNEETQLPPSLQ